MFNLQLGSYILDLVPNDGAYRLWHFAPRSRDPLARSPVQYGAWGSIRTGHALYPLE